jgi:hypothetical protein
MLEDESKDKARLGDEIKIRSADETISSAESTSAASSDLNSSFEEEQKAPAEETQQAQCAKKLNIRGKADAVRLLKELPEDEFLHLLEHSSPEQLQAFLSALTPEEQALSHLSKKLIERATSIPDEPRGALSIIAWWESRRILFNLVVGLCGLPTLAIVFFTGLASVSLCIYGTIEYGLLANLCYTAGWICELIARHWWKERARHLGPILFSLGFSFSIFLTLGAGLICILIFLLLRILTVMF